MAHYPISCIFYQPRLGISARLVLSNLSYCYRVICKCKVLFSRTGLKNNKNLKKIERAAALLVMGYNLQYSLQRRNRTSIPTRVQDKNASRFYTSVVTCIVLPVELSRVQHHALPWIQRPCRLLSLYTSSVTISQRTKGIGRRLRNRTELYMSPN